MSTDASNEVRVAAVAAATRATRAAGAETPAGGGQPAPAGRRRMLTERNRPLWMLIPGGVLMIVIIVLPLLLGIYMSVLNLDQYTLRKWISAPFIGVDNFV